MYLRRYSINQLSEVEIQNMTEFNLRIRVEGFGWDDNNINKIRATHKVEPREIIRNQKKDRKQQDKQAHP